MIFKKLYPLSTIENSKLTARILAYKIVSKTFKEKEKQKTKKCKRKKKNKVLRY